MATKTYAEKLKDPRWQKKRLEILNRDNFTCQICGDEESTLNVHHLSYSNNPWDVENELLLTLCEDCHKTESETISEAKKDTLNAILITCKNAENLIFVKRIFTDLITAEFFEDDTNLIYLVDLLSNKEEWMKKARDHFFNKVDNIYG